PAILVGKVGDEQIDETVVIVVRPGAESKVTSLVRQVAGARPAECGVAVIVIEPIMARSGRPTEAGWNQQIEVTVIIIISARRKTVIVSVLHQVSLSDF